MKTWIKTRVSNYMKEDTPRTKGEWIFFGILLGFVCIIIGFGITAMIAATIPEVLNLIDWLESSQGQCRLNPNCDKWDGRKTAYEGHTIKPKLYDRDTFKDPGWIMELKD